MAGGAGQEKQYYDQRDQSAFASPRGQGVGAGPEQAGQAGQDQSRRGTRGQIQNQVVAGLMGTKGSFTDQREVGCVQCGY